MHQWEDNKRSRYTWQCLRWRCPVISTATELGPHNIARLIVYYVIRAVEIPNKGMPFTWLARIYRDPWQLALCYLSERQDLTSVGPPMEKNCMCGHLCPIAPPRHIRTRTAPTHPPPTSPAVTLTRFPSYPNSQSWDAMLGHHPYTIRSDYSFDASHDLFACIKAAVRAIMHAIPRLCPNVCLGLSYNGFPYHLFHKHDISFHTHNKRFRSGYIVRSSSP